MKNEPGKPSAETPESQPPPADGDDFWTLMRRYAPVLGLVPGGAVGGYLIGLALDHAFSTTYLRFALLVFGVVASIVQTMKLLSRDMK